MQFLEYMQEYTDYEKQYICAKGILEVVKLYTEKFQSESDFTQ